MIRVAALPCDQGACGWYRVLQPLRMLDRQGKIDLVLHQLPDGRFKAGPGKFDVLVIQKPGGAIDENDEPGIAFTQDIERVGARVVYEVDDDLERVTKENPARIKGGYPPGYVDRTRALMRACRIVTTTTPYAAENLRRFNPEVRVVPNGLDLDAWIPPGPARPWNDSDEVRIVWACSPNHVEDARLLIRPFREIARRYPKVRLILAGAHFPELERALGGRIEKAGAVFSMAEWPAFARSLDADIWVAPLVDSRFARSKSNLKFLEGSAVGAAVVASDVEPYRAGPDGAPWFVPPMALARSGDEFVKALSVFIESPELRREYAARGLAMVREHYTAQHTADAWMRVFEEVIG